MLGKRIKTIKQVLELARKGKAVYCIQWRRPCPAAFFQCWQARMLYDFINRGYLYEFKKGA